MPAPGSTRIERANCVESVVAADRKARAMGCPLPVCTAATSRSSCALSTPGATTKSTMRASLSLSVPVLSKTAVSIKASASIASPPRAKSPRLANAARADQMATGVASPIAQGQATRRTASPLKTPVIHPLCRVQPRVVSAAMTSTRGRNHETRRSASRWMRPGFRRASSIERSKVSSRRERPRDVAAIRSVLSSTRLPAWTASPVRLTTG